MLDLYVMTGLTTVLAKQIKNSLSSFSFTLVSEVYFCLVVDRSVGNMISLPVCLSAAAHQKAVILHNLVRC